MGCYTTSGLQRLVVDLDAEREIGHRNGEEEDR